MTSQQVKTVAAHILEDRSGANYYQDNEILADYLKGTLGLSSEMASQTAEEINTDRIGANYYADVDILTDYLEVRVGATEAT